MVCEEDERFLRKVLHHVRHIQGHVRFVIFTQPHNHDSFEGWPRIPVRGAGLFGGVSLDSAVKRANVDAVLSPLAEAPARTPVPQVLYCTHLAAFQDAQGNLLPKSRRRARAVRKACANAHGLVVTSKYLQRKCLDFFGAPLDRTVAALPGVDDVFEQAHRPIVEPPYLLVVSDPFTRPWAAQLGRVFDEHAGEFPYTIVVAGAEREEPPGAWGPRKVHVEHCAESHLAGLYRHSTIFLYPALHDGACVRVLEALRAGACIVCPRSGAIPEIAADAPLYYNGASTDSLVQTIRRALDQEPENRAERVRFGQAHARQFDWKQTAWKFLSAFTRR